MDLLLNWIIHSQAACWWRKGSMTLRWADSCYQELTCRSSSATTRHWVNITLITRTILHNMNSFKSITHHPQTDFIINIDLCEMALTTLVLALFGHYYSFYSYLALFHKDFCKVSVFFVFLSSINRMTKTQKITKLNYINCLYKLLTLFLLLFIFFILMFVKFQYFCVCFWHLYIYRMRKTQITKLNDINSLYSLLILLLLLLIFGIFHFNFCKISLFFCVFLSFIYRMTKTQTFIFNKYKWEMLHWQTRWYKK